MTTPEPLAILLVGLVLLVLAFLPQLVGLIHPVMVGR